MKISQFRALIKEEVRKVLKESKTRRSLREGVIEDLQVEPKTIGVNWEEAENLMDYVKAKHKLGPKKYVAGEGGDVFIYKIGSIPYILVDEDGFGAIFKASDSAKVISAIKDGSYFDWNESISESTKRKLKEANELEGLYDVIDNPTAAKLQKAIDAKYKKLYYAIDETPALNSIVKPYMNRTDSFETAEDFKNYNEGLIEVFMTAVKDLKKVNSIL